jgi:ATP-dependent RNA helicase DeaD
MKPTQSIVFCHSRFQVEKVCQFLRRQVEGVDYIHAGLSQDMRSSVTNKFRMGKIKVLVATDVVSRGLDFSKVSHVFIYQLPSDPEVYVHRSGRTGRYDKSGIVLSLVTDRELGSLKAVMQQIGQEPVWVGDPPPARSHQRQRYKPK